MGHKFTSYSDVAAFFKKARKPHEGRPVSTSRVFRDGERYILRRYGETLCEVHPDNTLVLRTVPSGGAGTVLNSLFGLLLHYRQPGKYRVVMRAKFAPWYAGGRNGTRHWQEVRDYVNEQSYAYVGQRFDMASGECLNPKGDPVRQRVAEPASAWDKLLRRYQRGWRLRARIGAFDWVGPAHYEAFRVTTLSSGLTTRGLQQIITDEDYGNEAVMRIFSEFTWKHLRRWQRDEFWAGKRSLEHVFMTTYQPFRDQIRQSLGCFVVVEKK